MSRKSKAQLETAEAARSTADLESENEALRRQLAAKQAEKAATSERVAVEQENRRLRALLADGDRAEFPDEPIEADASLLYPDPTKLPDDFVDPKLTYYWGAPDGADVGRLRQRGYERVEPPKDHTMSVDSKHVLYAAPSARIAKLKEAERQLANREAAAAKRPPNLGSLASTVDHAAIGAGRGPRGS